MVNTANVKAVVVDLDRTLLHTDKSVSAYTLEVLNKCKNHGMRIMIATARPLRTTLQYCEMVDFDAIVVSNGARVIYGKQRADYGISRRSAARLLNALNRHPALRITLETGDCAYSNKPIADYETILSEDLVGVSDAEGVLKILVHLDSEDTLTFVQNELSEDLYYTIANGYLMQIMSRSATKWKGIKTMLDSFDILQDDVAYFGDDHDDIEPIKMCGLGIAVSNGIDEVKAVADFVAESNDADGVARFIEQMLLRKL